MVFIGFVVELLGGSFMSFMKFCKMIGFNFIDFGLISYGRVLELIFFLGVFRVVWMSS